MRPFSRLRLVFLSFPPPARLCYWSYRYGSNSALRKNLFCTRYRVMEIKWVLVKIWILIHLTIHWFIFNHSYLNYLRIDWFYFLCFVFAWFVNFRNFNFNLLFREISGMRHHKEKFKSCLVFVMSNYQKGCSVNWII